jgi:uncharacterized membrane protein YgcG
MFQVYGVLRVLLLETNFVHIITAIVICRTIEHRAHPVIFSTGRFGAIFAGSQGDVGGRGRGGWW